jgi:dihydropteroate synthase
MFQPVEWSIRDGVLSTADHTLVMGVVNVTPDSFSDGGSYPDVEAAIAHGLELWDAGADIIDVGGESTRPGSTPVGPDAEEERVVPVVAGLAAAGVVVSVDTMKPRVAAAAIAAGARIVNDVTALVDPAMTRVCAAAGVGVVLMHMQGDPQTMQDDPRYDDVVAEVRSYLLERAVAAQAAGIPAARICLDPGIGFGKTLEHNLSLLAGIPALTQDGYPVAIGTSRKGFLGWILAAAGVETEAKQRDVATAASVSLAVAGGAAVVRVHNVGYALQAARVGDAIVRSPQWRS